MFHLRVFLSKMVHYSRFLILVFLIFTGCGRRQRGFFDFSSKAKKIKINKIELPVVQNLSVEYINSGCQLKWNHLSDRNIKLNEYIAEFVGYNIYKFVDSGFIPKYPINEQVELNNSFFDENISCSFYYLIRAVFKVQDYNIKSEAIFNVASDFRIIQGPSSQVIFCHKK